METKTTDKKSKHCSNSSMLSNHHNHLGNNRKFFRFSIPTRVSWRNYSNRDREDRAAAAELMATEITMDNNQIVVRF